jgi:signal peptidase I
VDAPAAPEEPSTAEDSSEGRHRKSLWRELPVLIVIAFGAALLIKSLVLQAFFIPSESMVPTLKVGDRVLVEKVSYRFHEPRRGDVVVFVKDLGTGSAEPDQSVWESTVSSVKSLFGFPTGSDQDFIKRVIAVGGDTIEGRDGAVYVNGTEIAESYLPDGLQTSPFPSYAVPQGELWVMGDNRGNSDDSRSFGSIPVDEVVGRAFVLIWPPSDVKGL